MTDTINFRETKDPYFLVKFIMHYKYISLLLLVFFAALFVPTAIIAEDDTDEVFLLERGDKLLAFSSRETTGLSNGCGPEKSSLKASSTAMLP